MLAHALRSGGMNIAVAIAVAALACGGLAAAGGTARAAADGTAQASAGSTCPTVSATGKVTPAPEPGVNWVGCDLKGANLSDAALSNAYLSAADLEHANLTGANLSDAQLGGADISNGNLTDAYLIVADFTGANLDDANLTHADLEGAALGSAEISGANLTDAALAGVTSRSVTDSPKTMLPGHWTLLSGYLMGPGADLDPVDLTGLNLAGVDLASATLADANLSGAELAHADLTGISSWDLTGTPASLPANWFIADGDLLGPSADLSATTLSNVDLAGADLAGANLSGATLTDANLAAADLAGATLTSATLSDADMARSDLADASLAGATLTSADLISANLNDANLTMASLAGATMTAATAVGATWWRTTCPDGTSSNAHVTGCLTPLDTTPPGVTVTGVSSGHTYVLGYVPRVSCHTTDNGTVATYATPAVTPAGANRVGRLTATCAGAVDLAGNKQAAPVSISYTVLYGMTAFLTPRPGSTIARSSRVTTVRFRLFNADRKPLSATIAAALAAEHRLRATLRGPGITAVTANCGWDAAHQYLTCAIKIPRKVKTGAKFRYTITAYENLVTSFVRVPGPWGVAVTTDPETVHFR